MTRQIARDIERKVVEAVQDTMKRELAIAQLVLTTPELAMILVLLAKGATCTAAATIAGMMPPAGRAEIYGGVIDQIVDISRKEEPTALAEVAKAREGSPA